MSEKRERPVWSLEDQEWWQKYSAMVRAEEEERLREETLPEQQPEEQPTGPVYAYTGSYWSSGSYRYGGSYWSSGSSGGGYGLGLI